MRDLIRANLGLLLVGVGSYVIMGAGQSIYGPALGTFSEDLGLSLTAAGWLVSVHWIGCFLGVGVMYFYSTHITARHAIAALAIGSVIIALGAGRVATFSGAFIFGYGYGISCILYNPRLLAAFGTRGTAMLSLLNATFAGGAIAAPLIFLALGSSPALSFGVFAAASAVLLLFAGSVGREVQTGQTVTAFRPQWGLQVFPMVAIGVEACLISLGPTALVDMGVDKVLAAQLLSLFFVTFLLGRIGLALVGHLLPAFTFYLVALGMASLLSLSTAFVQPEVSFAAIGMVAGLFFPTFFVAASKAMGAGARSASVILATGLIGGIFAPIVFAGLIDAFGGRMFFVIAAGATGSLVIAGLFARRHVPELREI